MSEKVSIIIPVFNAANSLPKCIESCLHQTYTDIEIIIVIDGSPDNCLEIAKKYQEKDNRIIIINQENKGLPLSRRIGFEKSKGYYVYHLDADDYIEPVTIETLLNKINSSNADIVIGGTIYEDKNGEIITSWISKTSGDKQINYLKDIFVSDLQPNIWGRLIKRRIFEPVYVSSKFQCGEDYLANILMICSFSGIKIETEPALLYHYVVYNGSLTNTWGSEFFMPYTDEIADILIANNLEEHVMEEWAYFRVIKSWRYYLRRGGKKYLKNRKYVSDFYLKYYPAVKKKLTLIEQFELNLYRYSQFAGYQFSRVYVKMLKITKQPVN